MILGVLQRTARYIEERSRWSDLHAIGNSRLVRSAALIPIIGYLILFNAELARYAQLFGDLDVSWRLMLLYLGLSSVGAASLIYAARCPETIKAYRTAVEFTAKEKDYFLAGNNFGYVRDKARADHQVLSPWKKRVLGLTDPDFLTDTLPREQHVIVLMTARWTIRNVSRTFSRVATYLLYTVGFLIVSIPTIATMWNVGTVIMEQGLEWLPHGDGSR
jgi:hypothetical protein